MAREPRMARWERLYHERVAWLFGRGLYWRRFGAVRENRANSCFMATAALPGQGASIAKLRIRKGEEARVEEVNQFPAVERRRNPAVPSEQREKGEVAVFQELGKALTSSLQLDQVLRTIMEKIDEFLRPDNWSLLLLDEANQELYFELINCIGPEGFDPRDLKLLEALSDFAAIALENARHVKKIHELTITDDCTSLYNARHMGFILETEIYRSQRYNYEFSIVFIDLDHFKQVNDTHGHLIGSRLLAEIGNAL